jgi:hypothetical protein
MEGMRREDMPEQPTVMLPRQDGERSMYWTPQARGARAFALETHRADEGLAEAACVFAERLAQEHGLGFVDANLWRLALVTARLQRNAGQLRLAAVEVR